MLWFSVWTVLVVGSLVGAFFLLRHLYRSGKALAVELGRASDAMAAVADRTAELTAAAEARSVPAPVELSDPEPARRRRGEALAVKARRKEARAARHEETYRRWSALSR